MTKIIVAIPARIESSRLPGKVMEDIAGKPMIRWVLENCSRANTPSEIVLCTDNHDLLQAANQWGFNALITSKQCESGSERIASVATKLIGNHPSAETLIINVQGDQPFIDPQIIDALSDHFINKCIKPDVITPVYEMSAQKIHNPNVVKTLLSASGKAIYFSRSALPHVRGVDESEWHKYSKYWGHVGIYGYRGDVLLEWPNMPHSPLEGIEKLEQLRLIEAGYTIDTFKVNNESLSVDTLDQLIEARNIAASMRSTEQF